MITFKQYNQWQGQYCCMKLENLEIITTDEQRGVLCRCRGCFSAEFYEPRIFKEKKGKVRVKITENVKGKANPNESEIIIEE